MPACNGLTETIHVGPPIGAETPPVENKRLSGEPESLKGYGLFFFKRFEGVVKAFIHRDILQKACDAQYIVDLRRGVAQF